MIDLLDKIYNIFEIMLNNDLFITIILPIIALFYCIHLVRIFLGNEN